MSLEIIHQDESIVAVNKPAGLLVHRSEIDKHETRFLVQELRDQINRKVYPVHRLDKPTSGIMLFALDSNTQKYLSHLFENNRIKKTYQALVRGHTPDHLEVDHPLKEKAVFKFQNSDALPTKEATTIFETVETYDIPFEVDRYPRSRYSLINVYPKTGRRHQIRRHCKHISHPIIGDTSYGKTTHNQFFRDEFSCHRLMLQATSLCFVDDKGNVRDYSINLDRDFESIVNSLRKLSHKE